MASNVNEGLSGLLQWSEPIIFDRLRDAYSHYDLDMSTVWKLARLHSKVWRALISAEMDKFAALRGELEAELSAVGLDLNCLADADDQTMNELLEIVIARFRRSQRLSEGYHRALIGIAMRLAPAAAA